MTSPADDYRLSHLQRGATYDAGIAASPWDDYLARAEERLVAEAFGSVLPSAAGRSLDFACGTGRITRQVEQLVFESWGVDISPSMLDLCTLLLSLAQFQAPTLRAWLGPQSAGAGRYATFVNEACLALGLDANLFRGLVPLYLLVFLKLKAAYSERLRQSLTHLIEELAPDPIVRVA